MRILPRLTTFPAVAFDQSFASSLALSASWAGPVRAACELAPRLAGLLRPKRVVAKRGRVAKKDRPFTLRYGIEIEMLSITLARAASVVARELPGSHVVPLKEKHNVGNFNVVDGKGRIWEVKHDYPNLVEPATPVLKTRVDLEMVKSIAIELRKAGATTPPHAGLHVHVESVPFSARNATHILNFASQHEWHLFDTLNVHPTRREECRPLERFPIDRLAIAPPKSRRAFVANYANREWAGKQRGINMRNFHKEDGTIEFRYFNATLDPSVLELNHELVMALSHHALKRRGRPLPGDALLNKTPQDMCAALGLTPAATTALLDSTAQAA